MIHFIRIFLDTVAKMLLFLFAICCVYLFGAAGLLLAKEVGALAGFLLGIAFIASVIRLMIERGFF